MEKDLKILIIDDEIAVRNNIKTIVSKYCDGFIVTGEAVNALEGLKQINSLQPDIVLLDIQMPGGTGFEMLDCVKTKDFEVVFITAFNQYAIKAFKYNAIDYLLKPVDIDELNQSFINARKKLKESREEISNYRELFKNIEGKIPPKLAIYNKSDTEYLDTASIIRMEANGSYTNIFLKDKREIIASRPLKYFEDILEEDFFFRAHNSHLINIYFVKKYLKQDGYSVIMEDKSVVPIAIRRKEMFEQLISKITR